jgi:predicted alpha/beta superfamily hydrolase
MAILRIHYDTGFGHRLTLRGSEPPLSWGQGVEATWQQGNVWTYTWPGDSGELEFKPVLDDLAWSTGANYRVRAGSSVDVYPFFGPPAGSLHKVHDFYSSQLGNHRMLSVYLPPSYGENALKRYPVLYMHDGQNVFEDSTSFGGVSWRVDQACNALVAQGLMEESIVVGVANTGPGRMYEYVPGDPSSGRGGGADQYARFLIETVKPWVDATYRTRPGREDTALMGSSLGGLISVYLGLRYPGVFSKVASLSAGYSWNGVDLVREVETMPERVPVRFYVDAGTGRDPLSATQRMRDALQSRGYVQGEDMYYFAHEGGQHNEASWAARVHIPLRYLFPA